MERAAGAVVAAAAVAVARRAALAALAAEVAEREAVASMCRRPYRAKTVEREAEGV
jgi:hypothetical protein